MMCLCMSNFNDLGVRCLLMGLACVFNLGKLDLRFLVFVGFSYRKDTVL